MGGERRLHRRRAPCRGAIRPVWPGSGPIVTLPRTNHPVTIPVVIPTSPARRKEHRGDTRQVISIPRWCRHPTMRSTRSWARPRCHHRVESSGTTRSRSSPTLPGRQGHGGRKRKRIAVESQGTDPGGWQICAETRPRIPDWRGSETKAGPGPTGRFLPAAPCSAGIDLLHRAPSLRREALRARVHPTCGRGGCVDALA